MSDTLTEEERRDVRLAEGALAAWVAGKDVEFAYHAQALLAIVERLTSTPTPEVDAATRCTYPDLGRCVLPAGHVGAHAGYFEFKAAP